LQTTAELHNKLRHAEINFSLKPRSSILPEGFRPAKICCNLHTPPSKPSESDQAVRKGLKRAAKRRACQAATTGGALAVSGLSLTERKHLRAQEAASEAVNAPGGVMNATRKDVGAGTMPAEGWRSYTAEYPGGHAQPRLAACKPEGSKQPGPVDSKELEGAGSDLEGTIEMIETVQTWEMCLLVDGCSQEHLKVLGHDIEQRAVRIGHEKVMRTTANMKAERMCGGVTGDMEMQVKAQSSNAVLGAGSRARQQKASGQLEMRKVQAAADAAQASVSGAESGPGAVRQSPGFAHKPLSAQFYGNCVNLDSNEEEPHVARHKADDFSNTSQGRGCRVVTTPPEGHAGTVSAGAEAAALGKIAQGKPETALRDRTASSVAADSSVAPRMAQSSGLTLAERIFAGRHIDNGSGSATCSSAAKLSMLSALATSVQPVLPTAAAKKASTKRPVEDAHVKVPAKTTISAACRRSVQGVAAAVDVDVPLAQRVSIGLSTSLDCAAATGPKPSAQKRPRALSIKRPKLLPPYPELSDDLLDDCPLLWRGLIQKTCTRYGPHPKRPRTKHAATKQLGSPRTLLQNVTSEHPPSAAKAVAVMDLTSVDALARVPDWATAQVTMEAVANAAHSNNPILALAEACLPQRMLCVTGMNCPALESRPKNPPTHPISQPGFSTLTPASPHAHMPGSKLCSSSSGVPACMQSHVAAVDGPAVFSTPGRVTISREPSEHEPQRGSKAAWTPLHVLSGMSSPPLPPAHQLTDIVCPVLPGSTPRLHSPKNTREDSQTPAEQLSSSPRDAAAVVNTCLAVVGVAAVSAAVAVEARGESDVAALGIKGTMDGAQGAIKVAKSESLAEGASRREGERKEAADVIDDVLGASSGNAAGVSCIAPSNTLGLSEVARGALPVAGDAAGGVGVRLNQQGPGQCSSGSRSCSGDGGPQRSSQALSLGMLASLPAELDAPPILHGSEMFDDSPVECLCPSVHTRQPGRGAPPHAASHSLHAPEATTNAAPLRPALHATALQSAMSSGQEPLPMRAAPCMSASSLDGPAGIAQEKQPGLKGSGIPAARSGGQITAASATESRQAAVLQMAQEQSARARGSVHGRGRARRAVAENDDDAPLVSVSTDKQRNAGSSRIAGRNLPEHWLRASVPLRGSLCPEGPVQGQDAKKCVKDEAVPARTPAADTAAVECKHTPVSCSNAKCRSPVRSSTVQCSAEAFSAMPVGRDVTEHGVSTDVGLFCCRPGTVLNNVSKCAEMCRSVAFVPGRRENATAASAGDAVRSGCSHDCDAQSEGIGDAVGRSGRHAHGAVNADDKEDSGQGDVGTGDNRIVVPRSQGSPTTTKVGHNSSSARKKESLVTCGREGSHSGKHSAALHGLNLSCRDGFVATSGKDGIAQDRHCAAHGQHEESRVTQTAHAVHEGQRHGDHENVSNARAVAGGELPPGIRTIPVEASGPEPCFEQRCTASATSNGSSEAHAAFLASVIPETHDDTVSGFTPVPPSTVRFGSVHAADGQTHHATEPVSSEGPQPVVCEGVRRLHGEAAACPWMTPSFGHTGCEARRDLHASPRTPVLGMTIIPDTAVPESEPADCFAASLPRPVVSLAHSSGCVPDTPDDSQDLGCPTSTAHSPAQLEEVPPEQSPTNTPCSLAQPQQVSEFPTWPACAQLSNAATFSVSQTRKCLADFMQQHHDQQTSRAPVAPPESTRAQEATFLKSSGTPRALAIAPGKTEPMPPTSAKPCPNMLGVTTRNPKRTLQTPPEVCQAVWRGMHATATAMMTGEPSEHTTCVTHGVGTRRGASVHMRGCSKLVSAATSQSKRSSAAGASQGNSPIVATHHSGALEGRRASSVQKQKNLTDDMATTPEPAAAGGSAKGWHKGQRASASGPASAYGRPMLTQLKLQVRSAHTPSGPVATLALPQPYKSEAPPTDSQATGKPPSRSQCHLPPESFEDILGDPREVYIHCGADDDDDVRCAAIYTQDALQTEDTSCARARPPSAKCNTPPHCTTSPSHLLPQPLHAKPLHEAPGWDRAVYQTHGGRSGSANMARSNCASHHDVVDLCNSQGDDIHGSGRPQKHNEGGDGGGQHSPNAVDHRACHPGDALRHRPCAPGIVLESGTAPKALAYKASILVLGDASGSDGEAPQARALATSERAEAGVDFEGDSPGQGSQEVNLAQRRPALTVVKASSARHRQVQQVLGSDSEDGSGNSALLMGALSSSSLDLLSLDTRMAVMPF
jgi:hypothetical protein